MDMLVNITEAVPRNEPEQDMVDLYSEIFTSFEAWLEREGQEILQ